MATRRFFGVLLATALTFGLVLAGCDNGTTSKEDPKLNGTWVSGSGAEQGEIKLNNGSFEGTSGGVTAIKGTYTTSGSTMTMKITQIHGSMLMFGDENEMGLEAKWYTEKALKAALTEEVVNLFFGELFAETTSNYSVTGNTLTITNVQDGETYETVYKKK
jgi:hypothetical protein